MALPATSDIVSRPKFREGKHREIRETVEVAAVGFERVLERHVLAAGTVFSILYFSWALYISNRKELWFDELVSYAVDHLPMWTDAWRALQTGVDANPPLFHLVNRVLLGILGDTTFAQRASSIFGFWAMSLCLYAIVRKNHSAAASWVAAVIPGCSGAAYYATEARPYGMVMGLVSLAVLCWVNAAEATGSRRGWLAGLTFAMACAISCHYNAVFLLAPFVGAEATRAVRRTRVDWAVLGAIVASCFPLLLFYKAGLISALGQYTASTGNPSLLSPIAFWSFLLGPFAVSIAMAVAAAVAWHWLTGKAEWKSFDVLPTHTILIAAWFGMVPIVIAVSGRYVTHLYEDRYALSAIIGVAILIGAGFDALRSVVPGAAGLAILALIVPVSAEAIASRAKPRGRHIDYGWQKAASARPDLPVVYGRPLEFVQAWYNAPSPDLKRRIIGLVNVKEGFDRTGSVIEDLGVVNLKASLSLPAVDYFAFTAQRKPFYLITQPSVTSWVTHKLLEDGADLKIELLFNGEVISLVTWPQARDLQNQR